MVLNGQVTSAGRGKPKGKAGGRPPVGQATLSMLMDIADEVQRARVLDAAAAIRPKHLAALELARLYRGGSYGTKLEHAPVDSAVRRIFPTHRPDRRASDIVSFCRNEFLSPYQLTRDLQLSLDDVVPSMVETIRYGPGPIILEVLEAVGAK